MAFPDEPLGAETPTGGLSPESEHQNHPPPEQVTGDVLPSETYSYTDNWSSSGESGGAVATTPPPAPPSRPPDPPSGDGDDEEEGMARMSFLEHLEELRSRLIYA